jgi:predicted transcriptional regulator
MNIKDLRTNLGLSQQDLSDKTGIPRPRIAKWEEGKGNPKADDFRKLDKFFKENSEEVINRPFQTVENQLSLEKTIGLLVEDRMRAMSVIERLATILEKQYSERGIELDEPGTEDTITRFPEENKMKKN